MRHYIDKESHVNKSCYRLEINCHSFKVDSEIARLRGLGWELIDTPSWNFSIVTMIFARSAL